MRVDASSYDDATERVLRWARSGRSAYVCVANVHMVMEAHDDPAFAAMVNAADLVVPDGMPLVWSLKTLGVATATQVRGADLVRSVARAAAAERLPIALYGSGPETLARFERALTMMAPGIDVCLTMSPPFRPLSVDELCEHLERLRDSGARVVFVGLGCPKQERWMADHRGRIDAVMLGVGAAFDFHAGQRPEAPVWLRRVGLEWLFRLALEPRRLWRRYARHNPRFVALFARQWLAHVRRRGPRAT